MSVLIASPAAAADLTCSQWITFRTGDKSSPYINHEAPAFVMYVAGLIDGVNSTVNMFNGYNLKKGPDGRPVPAELTPQISFENTVAVLDRECTAAPTRSADDVAVQEVKGKMYERLTPIMGSMGYILHELNEAKGYK